MIVPYSLATRTRPTIGSPVSWRAVTVSAPSTGMDSPADRSYVASDFGVTVPCPLENISW